MKFNASDFKDLKEAKAYYTELSGLIQKLEQVDSVAEQVKALIAEAGLTLEQIQPKLTGTSGSKPKGKAASSSVDTSGLVKGTTYVNPNPKAGDTKEWKHPSNGRKPQFILDAIADGSIAKLAK